MCGIFFSLCRSGFVAPDSKTERLLKNRGPDSLGKHCALIPSGASTMKMLPARLHATFLSTVLSLRGTTIVGQPLQDGETGSILCWNGEAWAINGQPVLGNDSRVVLDALLLTDSMETGVSRTSALSHVTRVLSSIRGPFAFVFYDAKNDYIFYGRDCLGRRSLLRKTTSDDELILSSVCAKAAGECWTEVEADGIYVFDMLRVTNDSALPVTHIPHRRSGNVLTDGLYFDVPFPALNKSTAPENAQSARDAVHELRTALRASTETRIQHVREAMDQIDPCHSDEARVAILFSGGLDCTILARLAHDILPPGQSVDLFNVAFENPRIHGNLGPDQSPYGLCPDRITGKSSHAELAKVCPERQWRFVEVNVPYNETMTHRSIVMTLMYPHNTEMDLSISFALYFASRGAGVILNSEGISRPYTSTAHVLLSGLGADELFGGYQRHATAHTRKGHSGLVEELELDFDRLGKRNLGRDDRVISDSGKEVRFPYLDEGFLASALQLPASAKCDFATPQSEGSNDPVHFLEPGKKILRLLAWELGMKVVASEKKRAIQFGARTAKMETGKTKGTQVLSSEP